MPVERFRKVLYTPGDDAKGLLDSLPALAKRSLELEIYGFTDAVMVQGIIAAANRGVKVRVLNDRTQAGGPKDHLALQMLVDAGAINGNIEVKVVESERGAIDHLKQTIIDGVDGSMADTSAVTYGSFNYSLGAERQDNVFVLTNDPGECALAMAKFEHDWTANISRPEWQIQPSAKVTP